MLPIADSLVSRLLTIALGGFCAFTLLVALILFRPSHGQPGVSPFELPLPEETAAIVQAIEASPPETRPLVVEALNSSVTAVRLENAFPPIPAGLQRKPILERRFAAYETLLGDRAIRVELAPHASLSFLGLGAANGSTPPVRMMVALKTGQVLVIEHRPPAIVRSYVGRIMAILAAATLVILIGLGVAVRRTTLPVRRLARSARRFSFDLAAPDLPLSGPREIRDLSLAFNDMQRRIRDLVAERTRLLAAIAHDLRTYLTRLRLRADFIDDVDQRRRAEHDIADMSKLLDDTLLFAQQTTARCATDEICDAGHEVTILVEQRLEVGEPVSLISLPQWPIPIACARTSLHRMVNNLIDNAIRYGTRAPRDLPVP